MTSHLLRLSDLEAVAPGILKVIFGPDGDFKNAPPFAGPVSVIKAQPDLMAGGYLWIHGGLTPDGIWDGAGRLTPFDAVALDCRVPGVAARLLRLGIRVAPAKPRIRIGVFTEALCYGHWSQAMAAELAVVIDALSPRIAALNTP